MYSATFNLRGVKIVRNYFLEYRKIMPIVPMDVDTIARLDKVVALNTEI